MTESEDPLVSDEPQANGWRKTEMLELQRAMRESFGACTCMQHISTATHAARWVSTCDGHSFLKERDHILDRPTRMLHMRRDIDRFRWAEFTGKCRSCGAEDAIHDVDRWDLGDEQRVCIQCIHALRIAEASARIDRGDAPPPDQLPW